MAPAERPLDEAGPVHPAYAQPTPRLLYVHDDLSSEVIRRFGADSAAADLLHALFALLSRRGDGVGSLAVVDDTVFSGLTMRSVLEALPPTMLTRTRAFCLRGIGESIAAVARLCPVTAGVTAPGRMLKDVSFINASGLVLRVGIRRHGQPPLAFFDRPGWIRAWFPDRDGEVIGL